MAKIAILADRLPPNWGGGTVSAHYHLIRIMRKRGQDVRAFTYFDLPTDDANEADIVRRPVSPKMIRFVRRANNFAFRVIDPGKAAYQLSDIVQRSWGALRVRDTVRKFAPDIMVLPDHGAPGLWVRAFPGCRRVLIAHHNPYRFLEFGDRLEPHSRRDVAMAGAIERRVLRSIDKVICPSRYMEGVFRDTYDFAGPVETVPNMVAGAFLDAIVPDDPRPSLGLASDAALVHFPAGGNKFKGAATIPEIVERLIASAKRPFGVYISGAVGADLCNHLAVFGDAVRLLLPGASAAEPHLAVLKTCSFGIYPTLVENYSMALLESVLCGVPVATFDVGGNGEIIQDGVNGYLIAPYDAVALADAASQLFEPVFLAEMKRTTSEDAATRLSDTALAERYERALLAD